VAALTGAVWLLGSAVEYAVGAANLVTADLLTGPTPCADWDLCELLRHVTDSMQVVAQAMSSGSANDRGPGPGAASPDNPVQSLRTGATRLLAVCADAERGEYLVLIGDRQLPASLTALAGALELAVHGWDIATTCGGRRPVPDRIAAILLPVAPFLVTPAIRPGLFSDPIAVPVSSSPGDRLVAFLGRQPHRPGGCGPA
jgi:uncharacterized protein (TIGR03086 family)